MTIEILNLKFREPYQPYDVRIDRTSPLGNPFFMKDESKRDWSCDSYADRFCHFIKTEEQSTFRPALDNLLALYRQHGKLRLFCWCAPKRCHGLTIKKWLEDNV